MKWAWLLLIAYFPFSFVGCIKSTADTAVENSIIGRWELQQRQVGMMPAVDYPAGNANSLTFKEATYEVIENGRVVKSGTYTIMHDASVESEVCLVVPSGEFQNRIVYDNAPSRKVYLQITANKLQLLSGCFALDAGNYETYLKQPTSD